MSYWQDMLVIVEFELDTKRREMIERESEVVLWFCMHCVLHVLFLHALCYTDLVLVCCVVLPSVVLCCVY